MLLDYFEDLVVYIILYYAVVGHIVYEIFVCTYAVIINFILCQIKLPEKILNIFL